MSQFTKPGHGVYEAPSFFCAPGIALAPELRLDDCGGDPPAYRVGAKSEDKMSPTVQTWMKLAAWFSLAAIAVVTILPIGMRPTTSYSPNIERFCVMAISGGLFILAYPRRFWAISFALACFVTAFEPLQFLAVGRHPSIHDVLFKATGAVTGAIAGYLLGLIYFPEPKLETRGK